MSAFNEATLMITGGTGKSQRSIWIDVMRGIAILLVVLGHSIGSLANPLNRFILSFHMPLFFFISGLVAKTRNQKGEMLPFKTYLGKKLYGILIPQVTLFLLNTVFDVIIEHEKISTELVLFNLFNWFLIVLFYVVITFYLIDRIGLLRKKIVCSFLVFALVILAQIAPIKTVVHIETLPMAFLFYLGGYYLKPILVESKGQSQLVEKIKSFWIIALPIIVICSYWNTPITMYSNDYGNLVFFFITTICGIWMVYELSINLQNNRVLQWFGVNSIIIYIVHARMLNVLHGIGNMLIKSMPVNNYAYPAYWHYFLLTLILFVPVVYICNHWLWMIFGKKKSRERKGR